MQGHKYYVFITGLDAEPKTFDTRIEAETYMHQICSKAKIHVECTEDDKHEKKYSNHEHVHFYINRV